MLQPPTASISIPSPMRRSMTPTWAKPHAPPPEVHLARELIQELLAASVEERHPAEERACIGRGDLPPARAAPDHADPTSRAISRSSAIATYPPGSR
jgi:hypothetical protein